MLFELHISKCVGYEYRGKCMAMVLTSMVGSPIILDSRRPELIGTDKSNVSYVYHKSIIDQNLLQ